MAGNSGGGLATAAGVRIAFKSVLIITASPMWFEFGDVWDSCPLAMDSGREGSQGILLRYRSISERVSAYCRGHSMAQQNIIGPAVRRLRVEKGLTQEAFAARCQLAGWDLSRETLSMIEAGLRRVNDAEVMMLAKVLGCELKDMFPANIRPVLPVLRHSK